MNAFLDAVLQLAATGVLALGGYAIHRLSTWLRLREDSEVRRYLDDTLKRGVDLAEAEMRKAIGGFTRPNQAALDVAVARVAGYTQHRVPDALAHFAVTDAGLMEMARARLLARLPVPVTHAAG